MSTVPENNSSDDGDKDESRSEFNKFINQKLGRLQPYFEPAESDNVDDADGADGDEKKTFRVVCKLCPKGQLLSSRYDSNGNLKRHLSRKHKTEHSEYCAAIESDKLNSTKRKSTNELVAAKKQRTLTKCWSKDSYKPPTQSEFNQSIVMYIVNDMRPLSTVDSDAFRALFTPFLSGLVFPGRKAVTNLINENYAGMIEKLRRTFSKLDYVCTTADLRTARNRSYLGVTAHWIDEISLDRISVAIACTRVTGSHMYDLIASHLDDVFTRFRITTKITRTITDNGSNFVKAFSEFQTEFNEIVNAQTNIAEDEEIESPDQTVVQQEVCTIFDADDIDTQVTFGHLPPHFRCAAHTLNLVATTDAEKAVKNAGPYRTLYRSTLGKCTALWLKYSRSTQAADITKNEVGMALSVPNNTRWNSWYDSMRKISDIGKDEERLRNLCCKLGAGQFEKRNLEFLTEYLHVMQYLAKGLDILQGERNCYFGLLLSAITQIENSIRATLPTLKYAQPLGNAILTGITTRFNPYFKDKEFILAALTLPFFKLSWISRNDDLIHAKNLLVAEIEKYIATPMNANAPTESGSQETFNMFFTFQNRVNDDIEASSIMDQYLIDGSSDLVSLSKFPIIKKIFLRYNTALPSSAPVERLFSGGKLILTPLRNRLSDELFEKLLLLQKNSFVLDDIEK